MRERLCCKLKKVHGFTLAEVLIVVGILAILAAVSFPALISMRNSLRQTELDETAKQIFITAQNKMSGMKVSGESTKDLEGRNDIPGDIDGGIPGDFPGGKAPDSYVICDESNSSEGVTGIAEFTWMDDTAFAPAYMSTDGGSYVIEYNQENGTVYGVYYWKKDGEAFQKKSTFTYPKNFNSYDGKELRGEQNRKNRTIPSVGYYGGEAASLVKAPEELAFHVTIDNGARLEAEIELSAQLYQAAVFEVTVSSKTNSTGNGSYVYRLSNGGVQLISPGTSEQDADKVWTWKNTDGSGNSTYRLTLDSLEAGLHFADNFEEITAGDDLVISVTGYSVGGNQIYIPQTRNVEVNSLFGGLRRGTDGEEVRLENGRHLQNLSYEVSGLGSRWVSGIEKTTDKPVREAKLVQDIDWQAAGAYKTGASYDEVCTARGSDTLVNFYPISTDRTGLVTFEGNNYKITGLHVTRGAEFDDGSRRVYAYAGMFGYVKDAGYDIEDRPKNIIRNVTLINPQVVPGKPSDNVSNGDSYAGSLGGYLSTVQVENCRAYIEDGSVSSNEGLTNLYHSSGVQADGYFYTGGLIGMASNLWASNSFASLKVSGGQYAGGFAGRSSYTDSGVTKIIRCYSGGSTENGTYHSDNPNVSGKQYAGGFIGILPENGIIEKTFSTCSVKGTGDGAQAGAFAGAEIDGAGNLQLKSTYGMGTVFLEDGNTPADLGLGSLEDAKADGGAVPGKDRTYAYDVVYRKDKTDYPYPIWLDAYHGDWSAGGTLTGFVYYEAYQTDNGVQYGFWSPGKDGVDSLNNDFPVLDDGYGYLSDKSETVNIRLHGQGSGSGNNQVLTEKKIEVNGATQFLYGLPWEKWTHIHFSDFEKWKSNNGREDSFYNHLTLAVGPANQAEIQEIYYNPHFAKALVANEEDARKDPATVSIRTARHLYEMAADYTVKNNRIENQVYWTADWTYKQERDIDYKTYAAGTTYPDYTSGKLEQRVIGTSAVKFATKYDGGGHRISNMDMSRYDSYNQYIMIAFFGYTSDKSSLKNMVLVRPVINANKSGIAGLVYENAGHISGVRIISPQLINIGWSGYTAGFASYNLESGVIENCFVIPEQQEYEEETGPYRHKYGEDGSVEVNNYTNAYISGQNNVAGFVGKNAGTISNCGVAASVNAKGGGGNAAGFLVENATRGTVELSYANCYTAGVNGAAGFVYKTYGNSSIDSSYALRRVTNTGGSGYAAGFAAEDLEGTISNSYAAVSVAYTSQTVYDAVPSGTITYLPCAYERGLLNNYNTFFQFSRSKQKNCYYMEWGENYTTNTEGRNANAEALTYKELSTKKIKNLVSAEPDGSDTEAFSRTLPSVYPFPKVSNPVSGDPDAVEEFFIQYGDWPNYEYVGAEMTYYEVYKDGDSKYVVGFYNDMLDIDSLRDDLPIFLDGYGLLFSTEYLDMDGVDVKNLIQGNQSHNDKVYVSWEDNIGTDNTTNTNYLKSVYDMKDNAGAEIVDKVYYKEAGGNEKEIGRSNDYTDVPLSLKVNGRVSNYYFRILPPAATVTNAYANSDSVYQELSIHVTSTFYDEMGGVGNEEVEKERIFQYCPHFAKSIISTEGRPELEPKYLSVRTPRQLATLSIGNNANGSSSITNYYDKSFRQERDIDFSTAGPYAYYYVDAPLDDSTRGKRSGYRWFNSSIGNTSNMFTGNYDGQGFTITGLGTWPAGNPLEELRKKDASYKMTTTNADVSLFGFLSGGAEVRKVNLSGCNLKVTQSANSDAKGVLSGKILGGAKVTECAVRDSSLTAAGDGDRIGMAAGHVTDGTIDGFTAENIQITADTATKVGGAVGLIEGGEIKNVKISGAVIQVNRAAGGVVGQIKSSVGDVNVSGVSMTGDISIVQMKASNATEIWNGVGLVVGMCELGSRPVYVGGIDVSAADSDQMTVTSDTGSKFYTAGLVFGTIYPSAAGSGALSLGTIGVHGAKLHMETPANGRTCSYGGLAGAVGNVSGMTIVAEHPEDSWDFSGSEITVVSSDDTNQYASNSGVAGLIGTVRKDVDLTLPGKVTLPDITVQVRPGHSIPVSGMVNNISGAKVMLRSPADRHSDIFVGRLITENCDNTGGVTATLTDNTKCGELFIKGRTTASLIEGSGNVGGIAGTVEVKGTGDADKIKKLSVAGINITGAGNLGGFAGRLKSGTIENCFASADVTASYPAASNTGGFVGTVDTAGGASASTAKASIVNCYASGRVRADAAAAVGAPQLQNVLRTGGFFGWIASKSVVSISSCYSTGDITIMETNAADDSAIGGFGGTVTDDSTAYINSCYSLGEVAKDTQWMSTNVKASGFIGRVPYTETEQPEIQNPEIVDSMLQNLIRIMKNAEVHNRVPSQNNKTCWEQTVDMDSDTRGIWRNEGSSWMSALVYSVLGYPSYSGLLSERYDPSTGLAPDDKIEEAYGNLFESDMSLKVNDDVDSYYQTFYKPSMENGLIQRWIIQGGYFYWVNQTNTGEMDGYRVKLDRYDNAVTSGLSLKTRIGMIETGRVKTGYTSGAYTMKKEGISSGNPLIGYNRLFDPKNSTWSGQVTSAVFECYFLREDGGTAGLQPYNQNYRSEGGADAWSVADFADEMGREAAGSGASFPGMQPDPANVSAGFEGYPYPLINFCGAGVNAPGHVGNWPKAYHPLFTPPQTQTP